MAARVPDRNTPMRSGDIKVDTVATATSGRNVHRRDSRAQAQIAATAFASRSRT